MAIFKDAQGNDVEVLTKDEVAEMVNGAVRNIKVPRLDDIATKVQEKLTPAITEALEKYDEQRKANDGAGDDGKGGKGNQQPGNQQLNVEDTPAFRALRKELDEEKKKREQADNERQAEKARARDTALRQRTMEALASGGIEASRVKHALHFLVDGEKRITWDENDEEALLFKDEKGDNLPLADGLKGWLKSEEAKIYLPPRGAGGSGGTPGASGQRGTATDTKSQAADALRRLVLGG